MITTASYAAPESAPQTSSPAEPVGGEERLFTLDVLRGVALLGILLVNVAVFFGPVVYVLPSLRPPAGLTPADQVVEWLVAFFATTKFYNLFSFLFGVGFALQLGRAEGRGADVNRLFVRRYMALLGIGLVHAFLVWSGDILVTYALIGFVLLACRRLSRTAIFIVAGVLFGSTALIGLAGIATFEGVRLLPEGREFMKRFDAQAVEVVRPFVAQELRAYGRGDFGTVMGIRALESALGLLNVLGIGPLILAMFLLGLEAGRANVLGDVPRFRPLLRRVLAWGLLLGVPCNLFCAWALNNGGVLTGACALVVLTGLGGPAFCFVYAAALALLLERPAARRFFSPVGAAGRMALSNYLFQSLVCTTLAYGYGVGLFGRVRPAETLGIALAVYAMQLPLSVLWLRFFRFGPVEWLWRSLTYGHRPPLLLRDRDASSAAATPSSEVS